MDPQRKKRNLYTRAKNKQTKRKQKQINKQTKNIIILKSKFEKEIEKSNSSRVTKRPGEEFFDYYPHVHGVISFQNAICWESVEASNLKSVCLMNNTL